MGLWQCSCAYLLGQAMYGFLFGINGINPAMAVGVAGIASLLIAFAARGTLKRFSKNNRSCRKQMRDS